MMHSSFHPCDKQDVDGRAEYERRQELMLTISRKEKKMMEQRAESYSRSTAAAAILVSQPVSSSIPCVWMRTFVYLSVHRLILLLLLPESLCRCCHLRSPLSRVSLVSHLSSHFLGMHSFFTALQEKKKKGRRR